MLQQLMMARSNADAPGWVERSFVYVFALLGFLLFYLVCDGCTGQRPAASVWSLPLPPAVARPGTLLNGADWLAWQMQKHSEYLSEARRTLQRELKEMNAVRVDEDNWHQQVR